jgi:hypothetical protein
MLNGLLVATYLHEGRQYNDEMMMMMVMVMVVVTVMVKRRVCSEHDPRNKHLQE